MSAKSFSISYDASIMVLLDSSKNLYYLTYNFTSEYYENNIKIGNTSGYDSIIISRDVKTIVTFG